MAAPPPTRATARVKATSGFRMPNRIGSHLPPATVGVSGPPQPGSPLGEARKEPERIRRPPTHSRLSAKVQPDPSEYCCPLTASRSAAADRRSTTEEGHGDPDSTLEAPGCAGRRRVGPGGGGRPVHLYPLHRGQGARAAHAEL